MLPLKNRYFFIFMTSFVKHEAEFLAGRRRKYKMPHRILSMIRYRISPMFCKKDYASTPAVSKLRLKASSSGKYHSALSMESVGIRSKVAILIISVMINMAEAGNLSIRYIGMTTTIYWLFSMLHS